MPAKTYYMENALQAGGVHQLMDEAAPGAATTGVGWTVGKTAVTAPYASLDAGSKQPATAFTATVRPGTLITTGAGIGNGFISDAPLSGVFDAAAWAFTFAVIATTASTQRGRVRFRVYRCTGASGTGATEITPGADQLSTTLAASLGAAEATVTANWTPGAAVTFTNEYLLITVAWEITTAGGANAADVVFRTGNTRVVTSNFTRAPQLFIVSASDSAPAVDGPTRQVQLDVRNGADTATASDSSAAANVYARSAGDSAPASDASTGRLIFGRTAGDSAPAVDGPTRQVQLDTRTGSDSAPAVDAATQRRVLPRTGGDSAPAVDSVTQRVTLPRTAGDTAGAADLATRAAQVFARLASDSAPASDTPARTTSLRKAASDSAPAVDAPTWQAGAQTRSAADSAPATDVATRRFTAIRNASDSITVGEVPSAIGGYTLGVDLVDWDAGQSFTVEMDFRMPLITGSSEPLLGQVAGGYVPAVYFDNTGVLRTSTFWHSNTSPPAVGAAHQFDDNVMHRLGITYSGGTQRTYVDGVLVGTWVIGQSNYGGPYTYWAGKARGNAWLNFDGVDPDVLSKGWVGAFLFTNGTAKTGAQIGGPVTGSVMDVATRQVTLVRAVGDTASAFDEAYFEAPYIKLPTKAFGIDPIRQAKGTDPVSKVLGTNPVSKATGTDPKERAVGTDPLSKVLGTNPASRAAGSDPATKVLEV